MHDSRTVANRFLALAAAEGKGLSPMQLLKLVYIAHGWKLALAGTPLIKDEVQAWQYGPVIPRLYNTVRVYKDRPVIGPIPQDRDDFLDASDDTLIRQVYEIYGDYSGPQLSRITHATGTPWETTYRPNTFGLGISNDKIQDHYKRLAQERSPAK